MSQLEFIEVGLQNYGSFKELVYNFQSGRHLVLGGNGCLSGDTVVQFNIRGGSKKLKLSKLYNNWMGYHNTYVNRCGRENKLRPPRIPWRLRSNIFTRSYIESNGGVCKNRLLDVLFSGEKVTYTVTLDSGSSIRATLCHKFLTPSGYLSLDELKVGDYVSTDLTPIAIKTSTKPSDNRKDRIHNKLIHHPYLTNSWKKIEESRAIYEASINNISLKEYLYILRKDPDKSALLKFINPKDFHIHHINGDHWDNRVENLIHVTPKEHQRLHGCHKNFSQGILGKSKIVSIEYYGIEPTYDLSVESPNNNFVANGVLVHNSGKSTIFDSIPVCLFKTNLRGKDPSHNWEGDCKHWVKFRKDGSEYRVERYWGWKTALESNPKLFKDEEEISSRKQADTERAIEALIGVSYDLFISTIVVLQGLPLNFGTMKPTERKVIVEQLLGFSVWEDLRGEFQSSITSKELIQSEADQMFQAVKVKLANTNGKLESAKNISEVQSDQVTSQIVGVKALIREIQPKIEDLKEKVDSILEGSQFQDVQDEYSQLSRKVQDLVRKSTDLRSAIHRSVCHTCNQPIPEEQRESAKEELGLCQTLLSKLETRASSVNAKIVQVKDLLSKKAILEQDVKIHQRDITNLAASLTKQASELNMAELESALEELMDEANGTRDSLQSINAELENLKFVDKLLLPSSVFRSKVLEKYLGYINSILDSIVPLLLVNISCKFIVSDNGKGLDVEVYRGSKLSDYKSFSGGEKRRIDVALLLTFQKFLMESAGVSSNLLVWDEIFDSLDDSGVVGVISCIEQLFPESSSVFVITHNMTVKSQFDKIINVVKKDGVSTLIDGNSKWDT